MQLVLTPELLLEAYRHGLFPMAYNAGSPYIHWICPDMRGQLSITDLHIPRRLEQIIRRTTLNSDEIDIRINTAFQQVIEGCAEKREKRPETWINKPILETFCTLHERGFAHSLECWRGNRLVGGIYGLALGGAFFGESMFSRETNASKIALVHLAARLWTGGFTLFDTQFVNPHLEQFGAYEIPFEEYQARLKSALENDADFIQDNLNQRDILENYLNFKSE